MLLFQFMNNKFAYINIYGLGIVENAALVRVKIPKSRNGNTTDTMCSDLEKGTFKSWRSWLNRDRMVQDSISSMALK